MNLELTEAQQVTLHMAVLTRILHVKKLLEGWDKFPPEEAHIRLVGEYTKELEELEDLERKVF